MEPKRAQILENKRTLQFGLVISYTIIIAVVLVLLNIYPIMATQRMVFQSKQESLHRAASIFSSNLGGLTRLDKNNTVRVIELLHWDSKVFILVTDPDREVIYASPGMEQTMQSQVLEEQLSTVLEGKDVFLCRYRQDTFYSYAVQPIMRRNEVVGVVCVCEQDQAQGLQIAELRRNLWGISWVIALVVIALSMISSRFLSKRISQLFQTVQMMSKGQYSIPMRERGNDELTALTKAVNLLMTRLDNNDRSQKQFVANASHQLKTPLASIRLLADSLLQNPEIDWSTKEEFLIDINTEVDRLSRITEELLILARLESSQEVPIDTLDMRDTVLEVFHTLEPQAQQAEVQLENEAEEPVYVQANSDDLFYILVNLVDNGIKYNVPNGFVRVILRNDSDSAVLIVEDSGIGIPEQWQPHIFDRFFQVDRTRAKEGGGSGLGLSIVWNAVLKWHGTICVGSRPEGGTWFRVDFPKTLKAESTANGL